MNESRPVVVMLLPALDYDPTESAVIWDGLTTSGVDVRFATPDGEPAYADPRLVDKGFSVLSPLLMTRPHSLRAYKRMVNDAHFAKPCTYEDVDIDTADGVFVPGGHAKGVRTLSNRLRLKRLRRQRYRGISLSGRSATGCCCWRARSIR